MGQAQRNLDLINELRQRATGLAQKLGGDAEELGQSLIDTFSDKANLEAVRKAINSIIIDALKQLKGN